MAVEIGEEDNGGCRNMKSEEEESILLLSKGNRQKRGIRKRSVVDYTSSGLKSDRDYDFSNNCDNNQGLQVLCEEACWIVDAGDSTSHWKRYKSTEVVKQEELKYQTHLHFRAVISVRSDAKAMKCISDKLTKSQLQMYRKTCFGHFLPVDLSRFSGVFLHSMLLHEMKNPPVESGTNEMWFWVDNHPIRFGPMEFALVTGLRFGKEKSFNESAKSRFKSKFFPGVKCVRRDQLFDVFKATDWSSQNDEDAVRMALLVFLHRVLLAAGRKSMVSEKCFLLVDNLRAFNRYTWGNEAWDLLYRSLSSVLRYKFDKHMKDVTKHTDYEVRGLSIAFQIWMYEALDVRKYAEKMSHGCKIPRILNWKTTLLPLYDKIDDIFISKNGRPPLTRLEPTIEEMKHETVSHSIQYLETVEMGVDMSSCDGSSEAEISPVMDEQEIDVEVQEEEQIGQIEQKIEPLSVPPLSSFNREQLENVFLEMLSQHKQQLEAQWKQEKQQMQEHWKHEKELMEEKYQNLISRMNKLDKNNQYEGCCDSHCQDNNINGEDKNHVQESENQPELTTTNHGTTESVEAAQPAPLFHLLKCTKMEKNSDILEISTRFNEWMDSEIEDMVDIEPVGRIGKDFFRSLMENNWLTHEHIDGYISLLCKRQLSHKDTVSQNWTAVPSSFFTMMGSAVREKQSMAARGEEFSWPLIYKALVSGHHKDYFKPWHLVDKVFMPVHIDNREWVVVEVDLVQWKVILYDWLDNSKNESILEEEIKPLLENIVQVLDLGEYWRSRQVRRNETGPTWSSRKEKQVLNVDSGICTCKFIECVASGGDFFHFGGEDEDDDDSVKFRKYLCLGLWSGLTTLRNL